jgi:tRNA pseudouridine-54 N-methylase
LVNILILIETFSNFSKSSIDKGKTPLDIYKLCSIIREAFCYSYSIRKNNNLYFYFDSYRILIKLAGGSLRYLGPDERSQALLLKKALDKSMDIDAFKSQKMQKSTPGIFIKRLHNGETILENIKDVHYDKIAVIDELKKDNKSTNITSLEDLEKLSEYCYIYLFPQNSQKPIDLSKLTYEEYNLIHINLSTISGIENKILYINFLIDQQEKLDTTLK